MNAQIDSGRAPSDLAILRAPPHDASAEQAVLGALMLSPDVLPKIADWISESDFYRKDHRLIWRAITKLCERKDPVDAVTLGDWFDSNGLTEMIGSISYLIEIANSTPSTANIVAYAEIVVEKSRLRSAIDIGVRITEAAYEQHAEAQLLIAKAQAELAQIQTMKMHGGLEPASGAVKKAFVELQERYQKGPGLIGQPWPWKSLNDATKGLRDGVLYIVGARPSMGKSVLGLQTAVHSALRGNRTAFFSVEMGAAESMTRAFACVGEIPHSWVEHPNDQHELADLYWPRLTAAIEKLNTADLLIDETPALSGRQMKARATRAHMQKPLRLIVVDHMHDMEVDPKQARFDYGVITQLGKTMAKEFGCPVILLAQLNRSSQNRAEKRPTLSDLRESGEIEQKGDVILFLHREDYYRAGELEGVVEVIPAKGRNIPVGKTIYLQNSFSEMRLQDWVGPLPVPSNESSNDKRGIGTRRQS